MILDIEAIMRRATVANQTPTSRPHAPRAGRSLVYALALLGPAFLLAGCGTQTLKHGAYFNETDLQQIQPGMSQEQVRMALGSPSTTATVSGGQAYYYIQSTVQKTSFLPEKEVDRKVVAVYFNPLGSVDRVSNYGLKDGKVFDLVSRETPHHAQEQGLLKKLFRNLGVKQLGLE